MIRTILFWKWKSTKAQLEYPVNFIFYVLGISLMDVVEVLMIWILLTAFGTVGGWDFWKLGFMFGIWQLGHGLHHAFFLPFWGHGRFVRNGDYDRMLVRPVHPILQLMVNYHPLPAIGELSPGLIMVGVTAGHAAVPWNLVNVLFLLVVVCSGAIIEWAFWLFRAGFDFWFVQTGNLDDVPYFFLFETTRYPTHVYGNFFLFLLTFIFPSAFMAYYPTHYFFQMDTLYLPGVLAYASPLVALILLLAAYAFWSTGLGHYESTGT